MSLFSFLVDNKFRAPEEFVPRYRLNRVAQSRHQRLADIVQQGFEHACMFGDVETAHDFIDVLENQRNRWIATNGPDRRDDRSAIARMKETLLLKAADTAEKNHVMHMQTRTGGGRYIAANSDLARTQQIG
jgi:hypothetical protein